MKIFSYILNDKKIVDLQIFSTASLKFGDRWENFVRWKKSFAQQMASCWQIFCKMNNILCAVKRVETAPA